MGRKFNMKADGIFRDHTPYMQITRGTVTSYQRLYGGQRVGEALRGGGTTGVVVLPERLWVSARKQYEVLYYDGGQ